MANPMIPISLQGTMAEKDFADEGINLLLQTLTAKAAAQGQAAQAAQSQYEQAAAAPVPTPDPLSSGVSQLFSNLASVISGNPQYGERKRMDIQAESAALAERRITHLKSLEQNYLKLSAAAEETGNMAASLKYQQQAQKVQDAQAKLMEGMKEEAANANLKAQLDAQKEMNDTDNRTTLEAARITADARKNATAREGEDPETGFLKPSFYRREQNKIGALVGSKNANYGEIRNRLLDNNTSRLSNEKTPQQMFARLMGLVDPEDANKYLLTGKPIRKGVFSGNQRGKDSPENAHEAALRAVALMNEWFSERELKAWAAKYGKQYGIEYAAPADEEIPEE